MQTRTGRAKQRKPFWKSWKLWTLLVVLVVAIGGFASCVRQYKKETAAPAIKVYKLNSDASVKAMLNHYVSEIKFSQVSGSYAIADSKTVAVTIKESGDDVNDKMAMRTAASDVLKTWDAFKKSKATNFDNISVMVTYPTNAGQVPIIKTTITGSKLKQFSKGNSSSGDVPTIASTYWQSNNMPNVN